MAVVLKHKHADDPEEKKESQKKKKKRKRDTPEFVARLTPFHLRLLWKAVTVEFERYVPSRGVVDLCLLYLGAHEDMEDSVFVNLDEALTRQYGPTRHEFRDSYFCPFCSKHLFTDVPDDIPMEECSDCESFFCADCMAAIQGFTDWAAVWRASPECTGVLPGNACPLCANS